MARPIPNSTGRATNSMNLFLSQALQVPATALHYEAGRRLAELFPDQVVVEYESCSFNLEGFVDAGQCQLTDDPALGIPQHTLNWYVPATVDDESEDDDEPVATATPVLPEGALYYSPKILAQRVDWSGESLVIVLLQWPQRYDQQTAYWAIAPTRNLAERFYQAVCAWGHVVRQEVLLFQGGYWRRSRELYQAIQSASFENLVLEPGLKEAVRCDAEQFFANKALYNRYRVPWKRGLVLIGPPGNGKTHAVKALINTLGKPCLYVRSIKGDESSNDHLNIARVFHTAREKAPCVLVLEDLDALINDQNRSFFLNELDGFANNTGILVLATTNYPEKLDPSILDRPSRFDRKYHFSLPAAAERRRYLQLWNTAQEAELQLSEHGLEELVERTDSFSFAYLKELCLSALMAWINAPGVVMDQHALTALEQLRAQMRTTTAMSTVE